MSPRHEVVVGLEVTEFGARQCYNSLRSSRRMAFAETSGIISYCAAGGWRAAAGFRDSRT